MKKIFSLVIGALVLWLAGSYWAANWIDKISFNDFPEKKELASARFLWALSPAVNRADDAIRALKFSWLRASTEINRKEKKEISKITRILREEFLFVAKYLESNYQNLSLEVKSAAAVQLLTYINRVNLFQNYFDPALDAKLMVFGKGINLASPIAQENWYREMMIRGQLKGDTGLYVENKKNLLLVLNQHGEGVPSSFIEGAIDFYDGTLLCVMKKPHEALPYLESAAKKLASHPKYTTNLFNKDLNVLLLGKGMEVGLGCNELITKVISTGV